MEPEFMSGVLFLTYPDDLVRAHFLLIFCRFEMSIYIIKQQILYYHCLL